MGKSSQHSRRLRTGLPTKPADQRVLAKRKKRHKAYVNPENGWSAMTMSINTPPHLGEHNGPPPSIEGGLEAKNEGGGGGLREEEKN